MQNRSFSNKSLPRTTESESVKSPAYKVTIGGQEQGSGTYNRNGKVNNGMTKQEFGAAVVSETLDNLNNGSNLSKGTYSAQQSSYKVNKDVLSSMLV